LVMPRIHYPQFSPSLVEFKNLAWVRYWLALPSFKKR